MTQGKSLSKAGILELGLTILSLLEVVHNAGYTYNDLKLENIMIGFDSKIPVKNIEQGMFKNANIHLIDFGNAAYYVDSDGKHILEGESNRPRGNSMFLSENQLSYKLTSRRDDLESLCLMLVYLLNGG